MLPMGQNITREPVASRTASLVAGLSPGLQEGPPGKELPPADAPEAAAMAAEPGHLTALPMKAGLLNASWVTI